MATSDSNEARESAPAGQPINGSMGNKKKSERDTSPRPLMMTDQDEFLDVNLGMLRAVKKVFPNDDCTKWIDDFLQQHDPEKDSVVIIGRDEVQSYKKNSYLMHQTIAPSPRCYDVYLECRKTVPPGWENRMELADIDLGDLENASEKKVRYMDMCREAWGLKDEATTKDDRREDDRQEDDQRESLSVQSLLDELKHSTLASDGSLASIRGPDAKDTVKHLWERRGGSSKHFDELYQFIAKELSEERSQTQYDERPPSPPTLRDYEVRSLKRAAGQDDDGLNRLVGEYWQKESNVSVSQNRSDLMGDIDMATGSHNNDDGRVKENEEEGYKRDHVTTDALCADPASSMRDRRLSGNSVHDDEPSSPRGSSGFQE